MQVWCKEAEKWVFKPTEIDEKELLYRPYLVSELFTKDLDELIECWILRYSTYITGYKVSHILHDKILRLERDEHERKKSRKE